MAQTTTNYGLLKPEATDSYNHLIYDNPNMDTIDAAMKANSNAAITSATCIKSGTTHTITRSNTSASVMRFTATGDWNSGDTMIIDGVTVSPYLVTGEALKTGAYLINTEVIVALSGTRATVYSNQSEADTTFFDDSNVTFTADNVEDAIEALNEATNIKYSASLSVQQAIYLRARTLTDTATLSTNNAGIIAYGALDIDRFLSAWVSSGNYYVFARRAGDGTCALLVVNGSDFSPAANMTFDITVLYLANPS